jgi:hypothetical protein
MAKRTVTYQALWLLELNVENIRKEQPFIALTLGYKIDQFLKDTDVIRRILHMNVAQIQLKYIEIGEDSKPTPSENGDFNYLATVVGKDGKLLSGPEVKAAYLAEFNEFINRNAGVIQI